MKYIVKQVKIPTSEKEYPNLYGWGGATEKSPAWKAKMDGMHFSHEDEFDIQALPFYKECFKVDCSDLDEVFRLTNLWDEMDKVEKIGEGGHSTSVGDIIVDTDTGDHFMVCDFGFKLLGVTQVAA